MESKLGFASFIVWTLKNIIIACFVFIYFSFLQPIITAYCHHIGKSGPWSSQLVCIIIIIINFLIPQVCIKVHIIDHISFWVGNYWHINYCQSDVMPFMIDVINQWIIVFRLCVEQKVSYCSRICKIWKRLEKCFRAQYQNRVIYCSIYRVFCYRRII